MLDSPSQTSCLFSYQPCSEKPFLLHRGKGGFLGVQLLQNLLYEQHCLLLSSGFFYTPYHSPAVDIQAIIMAEFCLALH